MFRVTLKGFLAHKLRFVLTAISIALGIGLLAGTVVYTATIRRTFDDMFAASNQHLDADVRSTDVTKTAYGDQRARLDLSLADRIRAVPSVEVVSPMVSGFAQVIDKHGDAMGGFGPPTLGLSYPDEALSPYAVVSGRGPGDGELVLDKGTADKGQFQLGDSVRVITQRGPQTFRLVGVVRYGSADSPAGATLAIFDLDTAMRQLGDPGKVDNFEIAGREGVSREHLRDDVGAALTGQHLEVVTGDQVVKEAQDEVAQGMGFFSTFMMVFALVALFVGSFIIYNTFSIVIAQRTKQLGLLRALGASRWQVTASVITEALALGVFASLLGVGLGLFLAQGLKALMDVIGMNLPTTALSIPVDGLAWCVVAGVVVTVASSLLPARRASRLAPVVAMRGGEGDVRRVSLRRVATGAFLLAAGAIPLLIGLVAKPSDGLLLVGAGAAVVFLGIAALTPMIARPVSRLLGAPFAVLGETGHLAQENAMRNPRRTASTASALMVGVALVGTISILAASTKVSTDAIIDQAMRADFLVAAKGSLGSAFGAAGFSPDVRDQIAALPEVAVASPARLSVAAVDGESAPIVAVDPASLEEVMDLGITKGEVRSLSEGSIAVSSRVAADHGWDIGQTVPIDFGSSNHSTSRIAAIYDHREAVGDYVVPMSTADRYFRDKLDSELVVKLRPGVTADAGRAAVERVTSPYQNLQILDQTQYKAQQQAQIDQLLGLIYALLFLAVIIAVLGITNTLVLSIHERSRELGLLRAVGMTRGQVGRAVGAESVIIALLGAALGLAVGASFGVAVVAALRDQGITHLSVPFGSLLVITALAAGAGIVASLGPARRAAKVDVLRSIVTE